MKIIVVDNEKIACDGMTHMLQRMRPLDEVYGFQDSLKALHFFQIAPCDVAVLDIEMPGMNGIALAGSFMEIDPHVNIIFTTGYSEYALEAIELHASGYLLKPITQDKLQKELEHLRYPARSERTGLKARAFGNFEVFADGVPLHFKYTKSKELLAYLIDRRGSMCTNAELIAVLWDEPEGKNNKNSYFKNIRKDLQNTLSECGYGDVIVHQRGMTGIVTTRIDCDYYRWIRGEQDVFGTYRGEYMTQYSWAEMTHGWIEAHIND